MDPAAQLLQRLTQSQQNEKTFSDKLKERRGFVQGQENTAAPIFERLLEAPGGEARVASTDIINPLRGFTTENTRMIQAAEDDLTRAGDTTNDLLKTLITLSENQKDRALKERELSQGNGLTDLLETRKKLAEQGLSTEAIDAQLGTMGVSKGKEKSETSKNILSLVDQLLKRKTGPITGISQIEAMIPGTEAQRTVNLYDQMKGILSLENRTLLKGSGAISDYEAKVLEKAASAIGRNLSDSDFRAELQKLKTELSGSTGSTGLDDDDTALIEKYKKKTKK